MVNMIMTLYVFILTQSKVKCSVENMPCPLMIVQKDDKQQEIPLQTLMLIGPIVMGVSAFSFVNVTVIVDPSLFTGIIPPVAPVICSPT